MSEDFDFLDDCQVVIVWSHAQHEAMLDVERNLSGVSVLSDEGMQSVCVGDPSYET